MSADRFDLMLPRVGPAGPVGERRTEGRAVEGGGEFAKVLEEAQRTQGGKVRFSAHALDRISSRGLDLDVGELTALSGALDRLEEKGGRQSLVVMDRAALVVNVPSRTVVTAVDRAEEKGRVFTNIDSAVVMD